MNTANQTNDRPFSRSYLVARTVWVEIMRREEYAAFLILMGVYLVFALGVKIVGVESREATVFVLNMGLAASNLFAVVLTILAASRALPGELERRTIYPMLAKPITRNEIVLGKFLAVTVAGWLALVVFAGATWLFTNRLPEHQWLTVVQAILLQLLVIAFLAALTLLFSLVTPQPVPILLGLGLYFAGTPLVAFIKNLASVSPWYTLSSWFAGYVPDFQQLTLFTRFTDGAAPLPWLQWSAAILYVLFFTLFLLLGTSWIFDRKAL